MYFFPNPEILQKIVHYMYITGFYFDYLYFEEGAELLASGSTFQPEQFSGGPENGPEWSHVAGCQFSSSLASLCSQQLCPMLTCLCCLGVPAEVIWKSRVYEVGQEGFCFLTWIYFSGQWPLLKLCQFVFHEKVLLYLRFQKLYDDYFWVW